MGRVKRSSLLWLAVSWLAAWTWLVLDYMRSDQLWVALLAYIAIGAHLRFAFDPAIWIRERENHQVIIGLFMLGAGMVVIAVTLNHLIQNPDLAMAFTIAALFLAAMRYQYKRFVKPASGGAIAADQRR